MKDAAFCKILSCPKPEMKYNRNTNTLSNHLQRYHHKFYGQNKNVSSAISQNACYTIKAARKYDKTTVIQTLAKFYHEDELVAAKSELCKCLQAVASATPTAPGIDGLSKFVNSKGAPISHRRNVPVHRRFLEAEDATGMLTIADLCNAVLLTFVAADLDRVPGLYWNAGDMVSDKLTTAGDDILKRMKEMEYKLTTPRHMQ